VNAEIARRRRKGRDAFGGVLAELALVCAYMAAGFLACLLLGRI